MFNIFYDYKSEDVIYSFIESYENVFRRLYSDTWIEDEYFFHKSYIERAIWIRNEIKIKIKEKLWGEEIFWYKILDWNKSIKIFLKSFMLEVFFEEDLEKKIIFVEDIKINKK